MKRALTILAVLVIALGSVAFAIDKVYTTNKQGKIVDPGELNTGQNLWVVLNTVDATGDEPTDLADDERTYQTVLAAIVTGASGDEKIETYDVRSHWNGARFRCIGITENATATFIIYGGTRDTRLAASVGDCELVPLGQLAFVIGTQASTTSTYEMADTVVVTLDGVADDEWLSDWGTVSTASDRVAEASVDLLGIDTLVLVPTEASADCKLIVKGF